MTRKRRKFWAESVGGYGYTVTVRERRGSPQLYLTWHEGKRRVWRSLKHSDREKGLEQAKAQSATLLAATKAVQNDTAIVGMVLAGWETDRAPHRKRQDDEKRRLDLWQDYLGTDRDVYTINRRVIDQFVQRRARGIFGYGPVSMYTVGEDIKWLKTVLNWAVASEVIAYSPLAFTDRVYLRQFRNPNKKRPRATEDHFERVLKKAHLVNRRFPFWLRLLNGLGWRETAICSLRRTDFDTRRRKASPHGRILKRAETDKMGVERWVPMSEEVRTAFDDMMHEFPTVGDVYLFPAVRSKKGSKPWSRFYASKLLVRAEKDAKLKDHYPAHAYRRKWVNERKHLPDADVAAAGAWLSKRTLEIYQQPDEETLYEVVSAPRRLRAAKS